MRVVVTGALGHIGSRLVRVLSETLPNAEVLMVDNMASRPCCPLSNFVLGNRLRFFGADVLTADLDEIFLGANAVVHLAAIADSAGSFADAAEVERVNIGGTLKVADACMRTGAALVFVSTTSVYGTDSHSVGEDCSSADLRPQSPYAEAKLRSEQVLRSLTESGGLRHVVCRFGTIFGYSPGMKFHTAVNKFCRQAIAGVPITVWRTALHQQRPYLDLGDAVRALTFILRRDLFGGQVFNVLTLNTSVSRVLEEISSFVPGLRVEYVDSPAMNQYSYQVENKRFARRGFRFTGNLRQGIGETIYALRAAEAATEERPKILES